MYVFLYMHVCVPTCVLACVFQLWEVSSANEWKSIDVADMFSEQREQTEVMVKCSTWSAGGRTIICAARNAVFVSVEEPALPC